MLTLVAAQSTKEDSGTGRTTVGVVVGCGQRVGCLKGVHRDED